MLEELGMGSLHTDIVSEERSLSDISDEEIFVAVTCLEDRRGMREDGFLDIGSDFLGLLPL